MALTILQFALLAIFITVFQIGRGSAFRILTVPEPFNSKIDKQLNITCIPDGSNHGAKNVQTLRVEKGNITIALVRHDGIIMGPGSTPKMQAVGNIDVDASLSFITVAIQNPKVGDIGTYTCRMYYEDPNLQLQEEESSTNVTMDNEELFPMVAHLIEKVSHLEKTARDQEKSLKEQRHVISEQEKVLKKQMVVNNEHEKVLKEQMNVNSEHEQILKKQEHVISEQERLLNKQEQDLKNAMDTFEDTISAVNSTDKQQDHIIAEQNNEIVTLITELTNQEKKLNEQATRLVHQETNVNNLEMIMMHLKNSMNSYSHDIVTQRSELKRHINQQRKNDSFSSAFSVYGTKDKVSYGEILVFKKSLLNVGNHYNMATGVFTAPTKALYVFHLSVSTYTKNAIDVSLNVNNAIITRIYALDKDYGEQTSTSAVVSLEAGDKVTPYVQNGGILSGTNQPYTVFNGYLLQLL